MSAVRPNDIAIVGLAVRVPGARDADEFWANLRAGREAVTFFTDDELRRAGVDAARLARPDYVKANAVLADADRFDAEFFGFTPREAELLDVQQRVFLECAWTALEHAGYDPLAVPGSCGVFAGSGLNTYLLRQIARNPAAVASAGGFQVMIANDKDFLATRVSYKLNLRGPSVAVQSACSTSLVAVHLAVQSLIAGECDAALAGGVSIRVPQTEGYEWQEGMILSPDGHCRPFAAGAAGTIGGNGAGVVVLKRAEDAIADGDTIHAIIRGSAVNNDGAAKVGYTAPGIEGQEAVIAEALAVAEVSPDDIGYVEAHGTGTVLGDPIEVEALTRAFRRGTARTQFCALGSVKGNLGHLDTAAGVVGLVKAVLAVRHGEIPPSLHFDAPNPRIDFAASPFRVAAQLQPWIPAGGAPRRAGVSSFGIGGTNAHVVLESAPAAAPAAPGRAELLVLSARTETALARAAENLARHLEQSGAPSLHDCAHTLAAGRREFSFRRSVVAANAREAAARLREPAPAITTAGRTRRAVFLFPGQGSQYPGMGAELYRTEPRFREEVDRCAEILRPWVDFDVRALLTDPGADAAQLARTDVTQPVLFTLSYALARTWESWGVPPRAMAGHSIGEWVAACLAEVFTLEEALRLVAARGRLMVAQPPGVMLAAGLPEAEVRALLGPGLEVAAVNAVDQTVVAGTEAAVAGLEARLAVRGAGATRLATSHAFHTAMMEPAARALVAEFRGVPRRTPQRRWISNVTGTWVTPEQAGDPEYWAQQLRGTVRFADGLATLLAEPDLVLLEVGAGRTLSGLAQRHPARRDGQVIVSSLRGARETADARSTLLAALGGLWTAGVKIDWPALFGPGARRVPLPAYPFEGGRHWIEADGAPAPSSAPAAAKRAEMTDWFYLPSWKRTLPPAGLPEVTAGEWLVIPDAGALADGLVARLRARGAAVRTTPGPKAARWTVSLRDVGGIGEGEANFEALCALGCSLGEAALPAGARLTVVATGLAAFGNEPALQPAKALLHGPARVLPNEVPGLEVRVVDIAAPGERLEELVDALIAEARGGDGKFVAWRNGERWVQTLEPAPVPAAATDGESGGTCLVTGGLGGLGLVLAEEIFRHRKMSLVLLGRSPPAPEAQRRIEALRAAGAQVTVVTADVTDEAALRRVRDEGRAKGVEWRGLVHAAGTAGSGALARGTPAGRAAVLAPKVRGTLALEKVFGAEPLAFFVLMSSLSAQLGEFGQADYAAANAFLDAFATARRRTGRPALAIGWDAWRDTGMAARFVASGALAAWQAEEKARRLTDAEGAEVFHRALVAGASHLIISTTDLQARRAIRPAVDALAAAPRARGPRPTLATPWRAPADGMEARIAALWAELLGIEAVGADDNFLELGGHSLLATQMLARLRAAGVQGLTLAAFFEAPTVAGLAGRAAVGEDGPPLVPADRTGPLPLSFAQEALWVADRMDGGSAHYNEFGAQRIRGPLDAAVLRRALDELVRRHEILRTRFVERDGVAVQEPGPAFAVELPVEPLVEAALPARAAELTAHPFDLGRGPLLRAQLVRLAPDDYVLMVVVHHIVFDGWSSGVFFREVIALHDALARGAAPVLPPLAVQYADFAVWQRRWLDAARREQEAAFWRAELAGPLPVLALPADRPRPRAQGFRGRKLAFVVDAGLKARLEARGREQGASLFMLLLAGYAAVLARTAAQEEVIVGCPSAGRERRELEPLIGYFINPLPVRVSLAGDVTCGGLIGRVRERVLAAFAHAALPFGQVVEAVQPPRDPARSPVFQAMLIFQAATAPVPAPAGLALEPWSTDEGPARSDLDLYLWETPQGAGGYFIYNADLFEAATVQRLAARLHAILTALADAPATRLSELRFETAGATLRLAIRRAGPANSPPTTS